MPICIKLCAKTKCFGQIFFGTKNAWQIVMLLNDISTDTLIKIARTLYAVHGANANLIAQNQICILEHDGYPAAANAWRALKAMAEDLGRGIKLEAPLHLN